LISIVTRVELEGGVHRVNALSAIKRARVDALMETLVCVPFALDVAKVYSEIVATAGYSRIRILDRMIAAQAIVLDAILITMNGPDFNDIPGLKLEIWPGPEAAA
jgi:tRNA(fMet)-specific endonuclease VapC